MRTLVIRDEGVIAPSYVGGVTKPWKFGWPNNQKNLKISVFVGIYRYLVVFGFVIFRLPGDLVFFDLLIIVFKVFEKIWIWYFLLKQTQIKFQKSNPWLNKYLASRVNTNFCRSIAEVVYPRIITILKSYSLLRDRHIQIWKVRLMSGMSFSDRQKFLYCYVMILYDINYFVTGKAKINGKMTDKFGFFQIFLHHM